jgi:ACS family tartrate transporter-like MFS transporter
MERTAPPSALDRARSKAYVRLLPLLFISYVIAYVDRANVALAKLKMTEDLPGFDNAVIGFGAGVFFIGYFLLEIPGSLLVEKWSARKWISRIMVTWGIMAALTAFVKTPNQFYTVRFLLGLAEAGFFPGVIVYLTHWFTSRDRARALAWFFIATPIAQIVSPKLSYFLLRIGTQENIRGVVVDHPPLLGLQGWQWMYIAWGIPAVILGILVFLYLTDRPAQAKWLAEDEREALEQELKRERELHHAAGRHMGVLQALRHPKVLLLAMAYFFIVTGNYGVEFFLPSILERWYELRLDQLTWAVIIPPIGSLVGQIFIGWNSDRTGERRLHATLPIFLGAGALAGTLLIPPTLSMNQRLVIGVALFTLGVLGLKAYLPAFWSLPSLFLTEAAAAGSIGLINSVGNLGGFIGPFVLGFVESKTGSFVPGMIFLCVSMCISAVIILSLGLGGSPRTVPAGREPLAQAAEAVADADALIEPA